MLASEANQSFPLGAFIIDRRETAKEDPLKVKTSREETTFRTLFHLSILAFVYMTYHARGLHHAFRLLKIIHFIQTRVRAHTPPTHTRARTHPHTPINAYTSAGK